MTLPPFLTKGDKVALVSPAGKVDPCVIMRGAEALERQGFRVEVGLHACDDDGVFAGTDAARAADMQRALDDDSTKAVFCARGGYGCLRTHLRLDWSSFLRRPKWIIGFSDVTVFHSHLSRCGIASIHGLMAGWFEQDGEPTGGFLQIIRLLEGRLPEYDIAPHPLNRAGKATGRLIGGNLAILQSLRGTPLDIRPKGRILFIEDIGEHHYQIDRMMQNLKTGGVLEKLSGLVVGYFTGIRDGAAPYGRSACEIIREAVEPYAYPVVFGFPAGHEQPHQPLLMGGRLSISISGVQSGSPDFSGGLRPSLVYRRPRL